MLQPTSDQDCRLYTGYTYIVADGFREHKYTNFMGTKLTLIFFSCNGFREQEHTNLMATNLTFIFSAAN